MSITEFPSIIQLETVYACNAKCVMCPLSVDEFDGYQADRMLRVRLMSDDLFDKICEEITPYADQMRRVTIQLLGEPLLDKKLESRIARLKKIGIKEVFFSSNGSLFDEKRCVSILESGVDEVDFSVDGATKKTFEKIRVGLDYDEVINNIKRFVKIRNEKNSDVTVRIRFTLQSDNMKELDQYYEFWKDILCDTDIIYSKYMHSFAGEEEIKEMYPTSWDLDMEALNQQSCGTLWKALVIQSDGTVITCSDDFSSKDILGNITNELIRDVWHGDKFNDFRQEHLNKGRNAFEKCKDCAAYAKVGKLKTINGQASR
ncbi:MAG: radical SAM protein [Mariprofundaceae bacterium]|nr:radical SAM protein [Mariprofundaceae bacterium]